MLQGWSLLDEPCRPLPLMSKKNSGDHICIQCGPLEEKKKSKEKKVIREKKLKEEMEV